MSCGLSANAESLPLIGAYSGTHEGMGGLAVGRCGRSFDIGKSWKHYNSVASVDCSFAETDSGTCLVVLTLGFFFNSFVISTRVPFTFSDLHHHQLSSFRLEIISRDGKKESRLVTSSIHEAFITFHLMVSFDGLGLRLSSFIGSFLRNRLPSHELSLVPWNQVSSS